MLQNQKLTMLNKVLALELFLSEYLATDQDKDLDKLYNPKNYELLDNIKRNLSSIKALIKKS